MKPQMQAPMSKAERTVQAARRLCGDGHGDFAAAWLLPRAGG